MADDDRGAQAAESAREPESKMVGQVLRMSTPKLLSWFVGLAIGFVTLLGAAHRVIIQPMIMTEFRAVILDIVDQGIEAHRRGDISNEHPQAVARQEMNYEFSEKMASLRSDIQGLRGEVAAARQDIQRLRSEGDG